MEAQQAKEGQKSLRNLNWELVECKAQMELLEERGRQESECLDQKLEELEKRMCKQTEGLREELT